MKLSDVKTKEQFDFVFNTQLNRTKKIEEIIKDKKTTRKRRAQAMRIHKAMIQRLTGLVQSVENASPIKKVSPLVDMNGKPLK